MSFPPLPLLLPIQFCFIPRIFCRLNLPPYASLALYRRMFRSQPIRLSLYPLPRFSPLLKFRLYIFTAVCFPRPFARWFCSPPNAFITLHSSGFVRRTFITMRLILIAPEKSAVRHKKTTTPKCGHFLIIKYRCKLF